jgi:PAS domain S-box-containing protein
VIQGSEEGGKEETVKRLTKDELRKAAEDSLARKRSVSRARTSAEAARLVHELEVHQIELEMQNEELRQAHADVDKLLAQYMDLYDFAPIGYLTIDRSAVIRQANLEAARLLGLERSRLQGRCLGGFVTANDRRSFEDFLTKAFASHAAESCEVELVRQGQLPLFVRIEFLGSEDGQTGRTILFDLTERRQAAEQARMAAAEAERLDLSERSRKALLSVAEDERAAASALAVSEERLRKLYSAMSEGLALHHMVYDESGKATDYRIVDVNPAFETITGIGRANAVGRLASELYGTGSAPYIDIYAKVAETGEPDEFETDFAPMAKCFRISAFSPGKGSFATVFSDITGRKQTELRLAEQAAMLAAANDAVIGYDAGYRVTFWNRAAELLYGYNEAEAMGKVSTELLKPVYVGAKREQIVARLDAEGHVETESSRTTRDGRQLSVDAHVIVRRDEQGRILGYVSVDRDITERKASEARIVRLAKLYAMLSRVNETIVRTGDSRSLLDEVCRIVSEEGEFPLVWVGFVDGKRVVPAVCCGKASDYLNEVRVETEGELGNGPTGTAIREDRAVVNDDFAANPATAPWQQPALRFGFRSSASFPLRRKGKVVGAFTLYASRPGEFDAEQVRLFEALSADVSYALDAIDQERLRAEAEGALREAKETLEVRVKDRTADLVAEIEERKRAEERLTALSQYARSLLESSLDPLVTINAEGRITDVNEATIKATGASRVELIGTDFSEYFTQPKKAREGYRRVFAEGSVTDYPLTIRHHDGRLTDVLYNASVYRGADGVVKGVFAAARDITERKRAEAAVEAERQRLRDVLNMLPAYVVLLAPDYTVPFANRFFEERFGKSLGRRCYDYLFQRREPCENCESFKVLKTGGPHHWEWLGPDGRDYDINDFPFRDVDGSPLIMEVGIDITARKQAEQALQKAHDTLEVKVAERTAELKRSNEELEQFAYVASHDLQEPLRMVASYVELLAQRYKGRLDEKADRYIAYASGGAKRMHQLVNDLLAFSRVGTRAAPMTPVSLDRVVAQASENLAVTIEQSGAVIEVGPLPTITADETQLVQLFQNLIDNAIKFRGPERPRIRITADPAVSSVPSVTIRVADNGIGIDPRHQDRIFRLFQRLHTEQEYPGTGIGLAVCKKIVERHGGTIRVESEPGKGSTFVFMLPEEPPVSPNPPRPAAEKENHESEP